MKRILLSLLMIITTLMVYSQKTQGCILSIENDEVYIDLTSAQIRKGEKLIVLGETEYRTDPATGKRIKSNDYVATLKVTKTKPDYSIAKPINTAVLPQLKSGMVVMIDNDEAEQPTTSIPVIPSNNVNDAKETPIINDDKTNVVIGDAIINDALGRGRKSSYIADVLMGQVQNIPSVRLLDTDIVNANQPGALKPKYKLNVVLERPDVVNEENGGAIDVFGSYYGSTKYAQLRSTMTLSVSVVDVVSGAVLFRCRETGQASGRANIESELSLFGVNVESTINSGVEGYRNQICGRAIQEASNKAGTTLRKWFMGELSISFVDNSFSPDKEASEDKKMEVDGKRLYLGTTRVTRRNASTIFNNHSDLYLDFQKAMRRQRASNWPGICLGTTGSFLFIYGLAISDSEYSYEDAYLSGLAMMAGGIVWSVCLKKSSKRILRSVAYQYNNRQTVGNEYKHTTSKSDIELAFAPTGFRITF